MFYKLNIILEEIFEDTKVKYIEYLKKDSILVRKRNKEKRNEEYFESILKEKRKEYEM